MIKALLFAVLWPIVAAAPYALVIIFYAILFDMDKQTATQAVEDTFVFPFIGAIWAVVALFLIAGDVWKEELKK